MGKKITVQRLTTMRRRWQFRDITYQKVKLVLDSARLPFCVLLPISSFLETAVSHTVNIDAYNYVHENFLQRLGCPYTEGVDNSWIIEMIYKPGEPRIKLLQWLFSK